MRFISAVIATAACLCSCNPAEQPATEPTSVSRIVTLAPHLTELVFAVGADDLLVGVSAYSDFPPEAQNIPVVTDAFTVDQERLALLKPDLLIAWESGTPKHVIEELRAAGFAIETAADESAGLISLIRMLKRKLLLAGAGALAGGMTPDFDFAGLDLASIKFWLDRFEKEVKDRSIRYLRFNLQN